MVLMLIGNSVQAQTACGEQTIAVAGETIADIAERCDVSVDAIVEVNPELRSGKVDAGATIAIPERQGSGVVDRVRDTLKGAGREIEEAARRAGQSVSDYLADNPDLSRDLRDFGERIGVPGFEGTGPDAGAGVTVEPSSGEPGDKVTVQASGLRGEVEASVKAVGPKSEGEVIARASTDRSGRMRATVTVPDWAEGRLRFVVETSNVTVRSELFEITAAQ